MTDASGAHIATAQTTWPVQLLGKGAAPVTQDMHALLAEDIRAHHMRSTCRKGTLQAQHGKFDKSHAESGSHG
jgi:hypothetical protein